MVYSKKMKKILSGMGILGVWMLAVCITLCIAGNVKAYGDELQDFEDYFADSYEDYDFYDSYDNYKYELQILYTNPDTGYNIIIEDYADLLTDAQEELILEKMKPITKYGHVMFVSTDWYLGDNEMWADNHMYEVHHGESSTMLLIDMEDRYIWIQNDGEIEKTITKGYSSTITDNVYTYASDGDYYKTIYKVFEQENTLLEGRKIAQPMKVVCNLLISIVLGAVICYLLVRITSSPRKPSQKQIIEGMIHYCTVTQPTSVYSRQTKTYSPRKSSSGGGHGGGHSGGHSHGSGGGHHF